MMVVMALLLCESLSQFSPTLFKGFTEFLGSMFMQTRQGTKLHFRYSRVK